MQVMDFGREVTFFKMQYVDFEMEVVHFSKALLAFFRKTGAESPRIRRLSNKFRQSLLHSLNRLKNKAFMLRFSAKAFVMP